MDEEKELRKNKQLKDDLSKEIKNFQEIYSQELLTFSREDVLSSFEHKIKPSKIGILKESFKKFFEKLIKCL